MKNKKGYTLVELIITLAIVGIMVVPIFNAFIDANRVNLRSRRQISAAYLAQNTLEEIKGMPRYDFTKMDLDTSDTVDITDSSWSQIINEPITNGGTDFIVQTVITNITDDIGITIDSTQVDNTDSERTWHSKLYLQNDSGTTELVSNNSSGSPYVDDDESVYLLFEHLSDTLTTVTAVNDDLSLIGTMPSKNIDTTSFSSDELLVLNLEGNVDLSKEWNIHIINQSNWTIDAKTYEDKESHINLIPDGRSSENIYIGNSFPVTVGTPSSVKEYYRVVITVSHNGTNYEVIESTVGK